MPSSPAAFVAAPPRFDPAGIWYWDGAAIATVEPEGGQWIWPSPYTDIPPIGHVFIEWAAGGGMTASDVEDLVAQRNGWGIQLELGGETLGGDYYAFAGPDDYGVCPSGKACLGTAIRGPALWMRPWPLEIKLVAEHWLPESGPLRERPKMERIEARFTLRRAPAATSFFEAKLEPIFHHARCSTCHSLGSNTAANAQHLSTIHLGVVSDDDPAQPSPLGGSRITCSGNCHQGIVEGADLVPNVVFTETEWMAPAFDQDINWSEKTGKQICERVNARLPSAGAKLNHFTKDARIAWAVSSGKVPMGYPALPVAPPQSYAAFVDLVSTWVSAGAPCP